MLRANNPWLESSYSSPSQMASIAVGCLLAFAVTRKRMFPSGLFAGALGLGLLAAPVALRGNPELLRSVSDTSKACGFALIMIAILFLPAGNPVSKLLNSRVLTWIGGLSYSLYLWQQILTTRSHLHWWTVPATFALAAASYYLVERPFLAMKDSLRRDSSALRVARTVACSASNST
jgi:peptidoglycan/LPS O-acetylase OafA/YrhL